MNPELLADGWGFPDVIEMWLGAVKTVVCNCAVIKVEYGTAGRWLGIPGCDRNVAWSGEGGDMQWCLD